LKNSLRTALVASAAVAMFASTAWLQAQQAPAAGQIQQEGSIAPQAAGQGGRRGRNAGPAEPTPKLADGTVNLGRVPGEKGIWNLPYITNMAMNVIDPATGQPVPEIQAQRAAQAAARGAGGGARGGGGGGGGRGGVKSEPWMPFKPWAAAVYDYNSKNESQYDPEGFCLPPGGPRMFATPYPGEILQLPEQKRIVMIFEGGTHIWREIYMDGREHPKGDQLNPTYLGHSVGHYEDNGQTLVVDVVGFNENSWLDYFGHPHTDKMHVVEKFTRPNKGTLHYVATVDDPGAYTKPFTLAWDIPWNGTSELSEYICQENNRYLNRLQDDFGQPVFGPKQPGIKPAKPAGGTK